MSEFKCHHCDKEFSTKEALDMHNNSKHYVPSKKPLNKKKLKTWSIFLGIVLILILGSYALVLNENKPGEYDLFAQCLTDNNVKMFGAYWCPHCNEQKKLFGNSFDKVTYIECSLPNQGGQNALCNSEGIQSYPTWEFSNGTRQVGVIQLERLSELTNCVLN